MGNATKAAKIPQSNVKRVITTTMTAKNEQPNPIAQEDCQAGSHLADINSVHAGQTKEQTRQYFYERSRTGFLFGCGLG